MRLLSLCDFSGEWSSPYREAGWIVEAIDLQHGRDIRLLAYDPPFDGILAAPPCDHFANSGARWWEAKGEQALFDGLALVDACLRAVAIYSPKFWALENPVGRLTRFLGPPQWKFDPCDYGDPYTKRTYLWGRFIPPVPLLVGNRSVKPTLGSKIHKLSGRAKNERSRTPSGFAKAFYDVNH